MEYMYPFIGYQIRLAEATSFVYHDGTDVILSSNHGFSQNIYSVNIHDYEFNGTITSAIYSDGERINSDDYILAAFDGNECVGYAEELIFPLDGESIYPLMVYNNESNKKLTYEVYEKSTGQYYNVKQSIPFTSDMRYGNGIEPVVMEFSKEQITEHKISSPYPNPFNPTVNVDLTLDYNSYVDARVYDIQGREVAVIHDGILNSNKISWMANGHASGIYFLRIIVNGQETKYDKIVLMK